MEAKEPALEGGNCPQATALTSVDDGDARLIAHLIHDLKNPLGVILCYADIVQDAQERERREYCGRLQANARALIEILNGFALLSDLRAGRVELSSQGFDWAKLVLSVATGLQAVAEVRDQHFACAAAGDRTIRGDRARLEQAVRHLLLEALRMAPDGGALTISVSVDDERAWTEVLIPNGQRSSVQMAEGRKGALLGTNRPGVELAQRIVALHGGSVSVGMHERGQVVAIALPID